MRKALVFEACRDGYGIDQIADRAMTVGELKELLQFHDDDEIIITSHDSGYTYGTLSDLEIYEETKDGEWESIY